MASEPASIVAGTEILVRAGRFDLAVAEFQRFVREQPDQWATAAMVADLFLRAGDEAAADGRSSEALAYLSLVANWRAARGDRAGADELRARIDRLEIADMEFQIELARSASDGPTDAGASRPAPAALPTYTPDMRLRALRARVYVARGDAVGAAEHLLAEMADGDPALLLAIAEIQLRAGRHDQGIALVECVIAKDPALRDDVVRLGIEIAAHQIDAGFLLVEMAADAWAAEAKWRAAAGAFREFVAHAPEYVPALVRLREIEAAAARPEPNRVIPFRPARLA